MKNSQSKKTKPWVSSLSLAFQLGYSIAIPLVVLALVGRYLDERYDTSPWLLLTGILISLIVTSWLIYIKIAKVISELDSCEREVKEAKEEKEK